jgi:methylmalonyl-CoA mutase N-terminal domain/subunit
LRNTRDAEVLRRAVDRLRETARGDDNIFPALLVTVKARATLGEIADVFREIFGEYRPS